MKIMILNSGLARRLKPLTDNTHKSLLQVGNKTILERQIEAFVKCGFMDFLITTGPFEDKIQAHIKEKFPNITVTYVNNPLYDKTNYIYSMWLAREKMHDDIILLHGDLVFEDSVVEKIIKQEKSSVIVDYDEPLPEKDFKGLIINNEIKQIGLDIFGENAAFLLPLYYWTQADMERWMKEIDSFVEQHETNCYAENAFNQISSEIHLHPLAIKNEFCMEIDTYEDLQKANKLLKLPKKSLA
ncbi:Bifunctional IPC transferase and DIPP synthase [Candidatus Lokiarchaeum ossiferum]